MFTHRKGGQVRVCVAVEQLAFEDDLIVYWLLPNTHPKQNNNKKIE